MVSFALMGSNTYRSSLAIWQWLSFISIVGLVAGDLCGVTNTTYFAGDWSSSGGWDAYLPTASGTGFTTPINTACIDPAIKQFTFSGNTATVANGCGTAVGPAAQARGVQLLANSSGDSLISVTVQFPTPGTPSIQGILFHYQDVSNYMIFETWTQNNEWRIKRRVGNSFTILSTGSRTFAANTPHLMQVRTTGSYISAFYDGQLLARVTDTNLATGRFGVEANNCQACTFTDFTIVNLAPALPCVGYCSPGYEPVAYEPITSLPISPSDMNVTCPVCQQGKYNDGTSGSTCSQCPPNQSTGSTGAQSSVSCVDCATYVNTFNNGTSDLSGWTIVDSSSSSSASSWTVVNGSLIISGGAQSATGTINEYGSLIYYTNGKAWTSYAVSAQFVSLNTSATAINPFTTIGIIFRVQSDNVYYSCDWSWLTGLLRLRKHTSTSNVAGSGSFTVLYSDTISTTVPSSLNVTLNVVGNIYRFVWNGVTRFTYTDTSTSALTYGSVGIMTNNATNVIVDNLRVNFDQRYDSRCMECQPGERLVTIATSNGTSLSQCPTCPSGWVSNTTNQPVCTMCTAGSYANVTSCIACSTFLYSTDAATTCDICTPGYEYYTNDGLGVTGCVTRPLITPNTMRINGGAVTSNGVLTRTFGGDTLDFDITHPSKNVIVSSSDYNVTIYQSYQGVINSWNCPLIVNFTTETHIKCRVPAVIGTNLTYTVSINGAGVVSNSSTDQFSCPPPTITPGTIRSATGAPNSFYTSTTSLGEEIVFNGTNFGVWSPVEYWSVTYGPTGTEVACTIIAAKSNHNEVHCSTGSIGLFNGIGVYSELKFRVTVFGRSVTGTDVYNYPETPIITMIRGCTDTPTNYTGSAFPINGTYNCPTLGGTTITISGEKLYSPMRFTIAGKECDAPTVVVPGYRWTCIIPAGAGYRQTVVASQNALVSVPLNTLWYAPATVTSITGCSGGYQITKASECNRTGGDIITLTGYNFGAGSSTPPQVLVGGILLTNVIQPTPTTIEVTLGVGNRLDTAVLVLQAAGEVTTTSITVDYHQCQPGQFESGYDCFPCPAGFFSSSTGVLSCVPCAQGYFAANESTFLCSSCEAGRYSNKQNATICIACETGKAQSSQGQSECTACPLGYYADEIGQATCSECQGGKSTTSGSYSATTGATVCSLCTGYKFQNFPHATGCTECDTNQYVVRSALTSLPECAVNPDNVYRTTVNDTSILVSSEGSWLAYSNGQLTSHLCLPNMCIADTCSIITPEAGGISYKACCGKNRKAAESNVICGECLDNYYEWSGTCVSCDNQWYGWVILYIVVSWVFLLIFHRISQTTRGETKIVIYYVQMLLVFYGPTTSFVSWMSVTNANVFNTGGASCVMPLSAAGKLLMGLWVPLVVVGELFFTFLFHITYWYFKYARADNAAGRVGADRIKFHKSPYLRTLFALFIFSYNSITSTVLTYFSCTDINGISVVSSFPALHCDSTSYKGLRVLALALTVIVVAGFPLTVLIGMVVMNRRGKVYTRKFYERYGIIYETYRKDRYYWEAVNLLRRTALIAITVMPANIRSWRYATMSAFNLSLLLINVFMRPFELPNDQAMENFSLAVLTLITIMLAPTTSTQYSTGTIIGFCFLIYVPLAGMLTWFIWNRTHPPKVEHEHWLKELKYERETHAQRQSERAAGRNARGSVSSRNTPSGKGGSGNGGGDEISLATMSSRSALLNTGGASSTSPSPANAAHLSPIAANGSGGNAQAKSDGNGNNDVTLQPVVSVSTADTTTISSSEGSSDVKEVALRKPSNVDDMNSNPDEEAAAISGSMV